MRSTVTAVIVASQGGEWLDETIAGIASQTRRPNAIIAVNNGGSERVGTQLVTANLGGEQASRVLGIPSRVPFGRAVEAALTAVAPGQNPAEEWIWLLAEDSCPEPEALERILSSVQRAQSVAVAGPKLVDWDHPERIIELGQSLTATGSRWLLRRQELDQQQYDHLEDVLGVGPVGMLVRRDVWDELGGFDPAYTSYDDALDFCVRTRLAGYRVEVSPESRVRFARSGVAGPHIDRSRGVLRTAHRKARTAHLHRRIAYAPAFPAFFMWLALPLLAIARVFWALIREQPGHMFGEFVAALTVFFRPKSLLASRKRVKRSARVGWAAVRPLRTDPKTVRTARMIDREAILAAQGRVPRELSFVSSGGLAVLAVSTIIAIGLTWWAIAQTSLFGGGMAPLSPIGDLWHHTRTIDGVPADPFAWVLAVLGSVTFWNPSHALVLMLVVAIPLAALGAWIWSAQLTESAGARAVLALGFALSPVLLGSIASGKVTTLILAVVMPWLLLAATRCRESWSWAGTASLLAAVALAAAPVLLPVALIFLLVGVFSSVRGALRVLSVAIAPLVLFAPKIIATISDGRPLDLLADPGISLPYTPGTTWHLLLGFPEFGLDGWARIFDSIGLGGVPATLLVGVLMLPLALLALLGLYTGRIAVTILHALIGALGIVTAAASSQLMLTSDGDVPVAVWTGSGLVLYWLAVLGLAALGAETARRAAPAIVAVALVAAVVAAGPIAVRLATGNVPMGPGEKRMPALVQVAGEQNPNTRTLVVSAVGEHALRAEIITGEGLELDELRTAARISGPDAADQRLAELVAALASIGGGSVGEALNAERVHYVLLAEGSDPTGETELQRTLDQHPELASVGATEQGLLWRVSEAANGGDESGDDSAALVGTSFGGQTVWTVQIVLIFAMLLLALPTGEVVERPERRKRPKRVRARAQRRKQQRAAASVTAGAPAAEPGAAAAAALDDVPDTPPEDTDGAPQADDLHGGVPAEPAEPADVAKPAETAEPAAPAETAEPAVTETPAGVAELTEDEPASVEPEPTESTPEPAESDAAQVAAPEQASAPADDTDDADAHGDERENGDER
ncbi:glycosyltransferase family 2 protein [Leucobacter komagatae]|uniref:glycosyltransferase family 2 protein n=1 Tax=Leucobacter komagatae TaxID=55969 RepID=UPI000A00A532|nr:glycosyltransferase family 2 protein [Leucobacter komagatae]